MTDRWHPDRMILDLGEFDPNKRVVFIGIDWGRKDQTDDTGHRVDVERGQTWTYNATKHGQ